MEGVEGMEGMEGMEGRDEIGDVYVEGGYGFEIMNDIHSVFGFGESGQCV